MIDFLRSISVAAGSPYALWAYAVAAAIFLLAGARLRTVQTVIKAIASVPEADRRHVIESITGSVIPDRINAEQWIRHNRNRWIFLLLATALILAATLALIAAFNPVGPGKAPSADSAREAVKQWVKKLDEERYEEAYTSTFAGFQSAHTLPDWIKAAHMYRRPLGKVESRLEANSGPYEFKVGAPLNGFAIMYITKFQYMSSPIREVITVASPGVPDPWRVSGYNVDVPPDAPFLAKKADGK